MKPTKQQWDEVKNSLSGVFGSVYLRCDGYLINASIRRSKMKLVVAVFVNGWMKGSDQWHGKERDLDKMGDISRKFLRLSRRSLHTAKEIAKYKKEFGAKWCKERGINGKYCVTSPIFSTPGAFINHIKKHNESIEVLDYETYKQALAALPVNEADAGENNEN